MKKMYKLFALLLALSMALTLLAACGGGQSSSSQSQSGSSSSSTPAGSSSAASGSSTTAQEPLHFTYLRGVWGPATYTPDGEYARYLRENANVDIEVQIIPIIEYDAKVKTIVGSGSLPDMLMASGPVDPYWKDLENQGAFTPLEEYLETYPALKELADDSIWEMLRNSDGHIYFLPRTLVAETPFMLYYRKDVFDALGIEEPTTIAELETALETIQKERPDMTPMAVGNGGTAWMGKDLATAFGATIGGWVPDGNGNIVPDYLDPKTLDYVFWLQDMKARGLLDADAEVNPDFSAGQQKFKTGTAAVLVENANLFADIFSNLMTNIPEAELSFISPLVGPNGDQGGTNVYFPMDRGYYIAATAQNVDRMMEYLNWTLTDGTEFRLYGIEGKTYTRGANGEIQLIPENEQEPGYESSQKEPLLFANRPEEDFNWENYERSFASVGADDYLDLFKQTWAEHCANKYYTYKNPTVFSETNNEIGAQLSESYLTAYWTAGIITNPAITREEFEKVVQEYLEAGGQTIIDEFNAGQPDKSKPTY